MTRTTNWKNASSKYILREKDSLLANCDSHPLAGELFDISCLQARLLGVRETRFTPFLCML
jgi:hypothetical protein